MTASLLNLSRLDAGLAPWQWESLDVGALLEMALNNLLDGGQRSGIGHCPEHRAGPRRPGIRTEHHRRREYVHPGTARFLTAVRALFLATYAVYWSVDKNLLMPLK